MRLAVVSHKVCWPSGSSPSGWATDGGFPFQVRALSDLFDATTVLVPCGNGVNHAGESALTGNNVSVVPLTQPPGRGAWRKLALPFWLVRHGRTLLREVRRADAVHAPIPGDVGTVGIAAAFVLRRRLFVRHCGNWLVQKTLAEHFWKWLMERFASSSNVMLATGGAADRPSRRNGSIGWIFSTTLTEQELASNSRRRDRLPGVGPRLIIACRQEWEKGTGILIESLPRILEHFPGASLEVLGDGAALPQFRRLARDLGLEDRVVFHGKVDHATVLRRLQEADLFCYPTRSSEGFPKVVLEALACGLPVLATGVSVLPRLLGTGAGLVLAEATPAAVAEGVRRCLSDAGEYCRMSARALDTARQYSLERWRETVGDLLSSAWGPLRSRA